MERQRYLQLNHLINSKFTNEKLLHILKLLATRKDDETQRLVTDTHAASGKTDIIYEYPQSTAYPENSLLLEATPNERTNQHRMEMEPISKPQ